MLRITAFSLATCIALASFVACEAPSPDVNPKVPPGAKSSGGTRAEIETDKGTIEITFFEREAPNAVENFRLLAEHGYYDGLTFHRIMPGFMVQGGDPEGTGHGGQSAWGRPFVDEINLDLPIYRSGYKRGLVAMANSGKNTNGSQFFIMHQDFKLKPTYVMFGQVSKGIEVVDALAAVETKQDGGENSTPVTPPVIKKVVIKP
jgi:cyclophilin family peptidyl-prolyl cis-trans isomerase